ncbi:fruit bromelain-like [Silene latifolia]|uniref:fruit bromelain-like n=1 Tax=Silene latifolia TaxID=37657 RepID=UPI003D775279
MASMHQFLYFFFFALFIFPGVISRNTLELNNASSSSMTIMDMYEQWITLHGHEYKSLTEKEKRFHIFEENMKRIEKFNSDDANKSYKLGPNEFTDLTIQEFQAFYTGYKAEKNSSSTIASKLDRINNMDVAKSVDWRLAGAVTPVKNQKRCGSCWAFASIAAVEGINKLITGELVSLSEQELVDCVQKNGCKPGNMIKAYDYIKRHGIFADQEYPYVATADPDRCKIGQNLVKISGYEPISQGPYSLIRALNQQPVSCAINANSTEFKHYAGGVYGGGCDTHVNHAVAVIGYDTDEDSGKDYWIIKNSWGKSWGENGYMRLLRNESLCPITTYCTYPYM